MSNSAINTSNVALSSSPSGWLSLVNRSLAAWDDIAAADQHDKIHPRSDIQSYRSLDEFLAQSGNRLMFWFFQRRDKFMSQDRMRKWCRDDLDNYVLLPASPGFVWRQDCFFVSHFWRTPAHPDPDGSYLRLHQAELKPQAWRYVWVDWTCVPQAPRTVSETAYFQHCLRTMPGIISNCGFIHFYPPFKPRLWILYEIAEYVFTCSDGMDMTSDIAPFLEHIYEMVKNGVQTVLTKYSYRCSDDRDRRYIVSRLELLVLLRRLGYHVDSIRKIMNHVTWFDVSDVALYPGMSTEVNRYKGTLVLDGRTYNFTPFPPWVSM